MGSAPNVSKLDADENRPGLALKEASILHACTCLDHSQENRVALAPHTHTRGHVHSGLSAELGIVENIVAALDLELLWDPTYMGKRQ